MNMMMQTKNKTAHTATITIAALRNVLCPETKPSGKKIMNTKV